MSTPEIKDGLRGFTPGPWTVHPRAETAVTGATGFVVAACGGFSSNRRDPDDLNAELVANARLIALAPELVESHQRLAAVAKQCASECAECEGAGYIVTKHGEGNGPDATEDEVIGCAACFDIRAALADIPDELKS